ncbi:MAG: SPOR domain-containing protein, partial [Rhodoferax sp.]
AASAASPVPAPTVAASAPAPAPTAAASMPTTPVSAAAAAKEVSAAPATTASAVRPTAHKRPPRVREPVANRRFFIHVGEFAVDSNAANAHARLMRADLPAFTQVLETANGRRTQVRVGPFDTYPEATAAAQRVRAQRLDAAIIQQ